MTRDMTPRGYAVTKSFEGRALKSYRDVVGVWTIGYGNTNHDEFAVQYLGGKIGPGMSITDEQADYLLHQSMRRKYLPAVERALGSGVPDGAFDAGGSFHYNTGAIARASWVPKFKRGEDFKASLMSWNKAGGKEWAGLTRRRAREYAMAKNGDYGPEGHAAPPTVNEQGRATGTSHPGMLRKGDELPEVKDLQQKLIALGYKVEATGKFDDATDKAVRSFQKAHPHLGLDGVVGPATRTAMQRELDMKRKLATSTTATGAPSITATAVDQVTGGGMPGWFYGAMAVLVVGTALYYGWKYRDEIRGWIARKAAGGKDA